MEQYNIGYVNPDNNNGVEMSVGYPFQCSVRTTVEQCLKLVATILSGAPRAHSSKEEPMESALSLVASYLAKGEELSSECNTSIICSGIMPLFAVTN